MITTVGKFALRGLVALFLILFTTTQLKSLPLSSNRHIAQILSSYNSPGRSAWFSEAGLLRFNNTDGLKTVYETWGEGAKGYSCDEVEVRGGEQVCLSTMRLTKIIYEHSAALSRSQLPDADIEKEEAILRRTYAQLSGLRGKRILFLGDSNDRGVIDDFDEAMPTSSRMAILPENGQIIPLQPDWTSRFFNIRLAETASSLPTSNYSLSDPLHPDDFRIDFIFTFGVVYYGSVEKVLERIALLDRVIGDNVEYDMILTNSGMWDARKMKDFHPNLDPAVGLHADDLGLYMSLYTSLIERLRERYGHNVPFALRPTHSCNPAVGENPIREEHFRQGQHEVARRTGSTVLPFARLMRNQQAYYLDGYHPDTAANMIHMETVLRLVDEL